MLQISTKSPKNEKPKEEGFWAGSCLLRYTGYYVWCFHFIRPVVQWGVKNVPVSAASATVAGCISLCLGESDALLAPNWE
eukprot:1771549-Amphidinium_carterae.1